MLLAVGHAPAVLLRVGRSRLPHSQRPRGLASRTAAHRHVHDARGDVPDVRDAVQLAAGSLFNCVRTRGGQVRCWGANANGQSTPPAAWG